MRKRAAAGEAGQLLHARRRWLGAGARFKPLPARGFGGQLRPEFDTLALHGAATERDSLIRPLTLHLAAGGWLRCVLALQQREDRSREF